MRVKRDPKAEGVQAEGRRPEVGDLNPSAFSLLYLSRFATCPQCYISAECLSKKVDSVTHGVYSYRFERAPGRSQSVEERARILTAQMILPHELTSGLTDEMSEESGTYKLRHGCCECVILGWGSVRLLPSSE